MDIKFPRIRLNFVIFQFQKTSPGSWITRERVGVAADLLSVINHPMNTAKSSREELKYLANKTPISPSPPWANRGVIHLYPEQTPRWWPGHLCAWLQTKGNKFRLRVAMPSAPANLQLPMQAIAEGSMLPLLTFYSCTLPHNYTTHNPATPSSFFYRSHPQAFWQELFASYIFYSWGCRGDTQRLDFISQLYRMEKKRIRGEGSGFVDLEEGAEERAKLEISSWQPFSRRVIRIYFQLYTRISRLQYS